MQFVRCAASNTAISELSVSEGDCSLSISMAGRIRLGVLKPYALVNVKKIKLDFYQHDCVHNCHYSAYKDQDSGMEGPFSRKRVFFPNGSL